MERLLAHNLRRIERLPRRGLLRFLDRERSKENTKKLRATARRVALLQSDTEVDIDLARIEGELYQGEP